MNTTDTPTFSNFLQESTLSEKTQYISRYQPDLLFPIPRSANREKMGITGDLPFYGLDMWHAYEVSWLNQSGKPEVAIARFTIPCDSAYLVESKSFKLYLNSFNDTKFNSRHTVTTTLEKDLSQAAGSQVNVQLFELTTFCQAGIQVLRGECLDDLDININCYDVNPDSLIAEGDVVSESLHSNLLKSNCPCTNQPDWGSVQIDYRGPSINRAGLLKYIVSYRHHQGFHEQCVEQIFLDIMQHCQPQELTVMAYYTRRGGLDINPIRSTNAGKVHKILRHVRQ